MVGNIGQALWQKQENLTTDKHGLHGYREKAEDGESQRLARSPGLACSSASSVPLRFKGFAFLLSRRENSALALRSFRSSTGSIYTVTNGYRNPGPSDASQARPERKFCRHQLQKPGDRSRRHFWLRHRV